MRIALLASIALGLVACASDPAAVATPGPRVVCTTEAPTGSNLKVRRCWTEEQTAQQQQDVRAIGDSIGRTRQATERR